MELNKELEKCEFCKNASTKYPLGPCKNLENLYFHDKCLVFSSGLYQTMNGANKRENVQRTSASKVEKLLQLHRSQKCAFCREIGATIKCFRNDCPIFFHLPCGLQSKMTLHLYFDEYQSFCPLHIPVCIFDEEMVVGIEDRLAVRPDCCRKQIYHFECIKKYVLGAGKSSKCPFCNEEEKFHEFMKSNGIKLSNKIPKWAESRIQGSHLRCEASKCLCNAKGRRFHHNENSPYWYMLECQYCGSAGIHLKCGGIVDRKWVCKICAEDSSGKYCKMTGEKKEKSSDTIFSKFTITLPPLPKRKIRS